MDFGKLLNQVLDVAQSSLKETVSGNSTADKAAKIGGGAAALGILSMVLGRNGGANLTKLGSLAALGGLAYKAYQAYQQNQAQGATVEEANFLENNQASQVILQAMIAAAAADGVISEEEKAAIFSEANANAEAQQWLAAEFNQPATVAEIAQQVGNNQALAAQVYLAARVVCADLERKEIVFLGNLAQALNLDDALVAQLEQQAGF